MKKKLLLGLMPYWTPLVPPFGISCLKGYLEQEGYIINSFDLNVNDYFNNLYNDYTLHIRKWIPKKKQGNLYNVANDILNNHLMARLKCTDTCEPEYIEFIKKLVWNNFYVDGNDKLIIGLNEILDDFYSKIEEFILSEIEREKPDVFGLSVFRNTLPASMHAFKIVKEKYPNILTVIGGPVFSQELIFNTPNFDNFLNEANYIDKILIGEGEILFKKLLENSFAEEKKVYTLKDIKNAVLDINTAPLPVYNKDELGYYTYLSVYSSRSCPYQCSFCSETNNWGRFRKKDVNIVVNELNIIHQKYNTQLFLMADSLLNPIIRDLAEELINSDKAFYYDGYLKVDNHACDKDKVLEWRRSGFYRARLGIESGSQKVLDLMDKKISIDQVKTTIKNLAKAGIKTSTYWICGHPGEEEEDFQKSLDLIEELKDYLYEAECNPFRYFNSGQSSSGSWDSQFEKYALYPEYSEKYLLNQTYQLKTEPSRKIIYERVSRFVNHCKKLGIPNPYSLKEVYEADNRWIGLHKNAVPNLLDFDKDYVDECKNVMYS